jgi:16S rRNA (adenine1518-N6/adenine1519-N6)-dimethyltransferase
MPDLPIQIVDKNNNPISSATKQQAWREGLIHRIVRINILNEEGKLLIQKRSQQKELFPGRWDNSTAGHVDAGETYEQAALRELNEELGLDDFKLKKIDDYYEESADDWRQLKRFVRTYKLVLKKPLPTFKLAPDEVTLVKWMDIAVLKELVKNHPEQVSDGLAQVMNRYF